MRQVAFRYKVISVPRKRDIHKKPIPRLGGLAIFISFLIVSLLFFVFSNISFGTSNIIGLDKHLAGILLGGLIITLSMLIDDIYGSPAWQKLIFQILAVITVISAGIGINTLTNPFGGAIDLNSVYVPIVTINGITYHFSLWSDLLTLIWMIGMMNVINFIDGVDGLAAGISTIAAGTIFLLAISVSISQPALAFVAIILAGSSAGFLIWNFPPAKIFMGDSGSMFLGYMLGLLPLISGGKLATAFLVLGFPIVDGLLVAGGRIIRKQNPFTSPDKTHLHHRFIAAGFSQRQSVIFLYLIAIAFAWVALRSTTAEKLIAAIVLIVLLITLIFYLRYRARKLAS